MTNNGKQINALLFFLLWLVSARAVAGESKEILLSDDLTYEFVTHNADYLIDNKELYTIKEISSPECTDSFRTINSEGFLPENEQTIWLRFRLANRTGTHHEWFLEYDYFKSNIELEFYLPQSDQTFRVNRVYPGIPSSELGHAYRNYVFSIILYPGEAKTFYMKVKTSAALYLVLKLWHPAAFQNMVRNSQVFTGLFLGIIFIMAFYNFFLFLSFKDRSYIFYILFILSLAILQLNNHHIVTQWFPVLGSYETIITTIFKLLSFICFLFFSRNFLSIKKYFPLPDMILHIIIYAVVGTGLLSFSFAIFKTINNIIMGASGVLVLILAVLVLVKGNRVAVFFLVSMTALTGFGILALIPVEALYIKSIDFLVPFFIDIGSLLMVVLFSFGLAYRITILQKEKEQTDRLKEMDRIKSRFFATISHEFRTPLTLILSPLEDMLEACTEPEQKRKFGLMIRNSYRLLRLVNQLLDLSRLESRKMKIHVCEQNIVSFTKGIVECFSYIAGQNQQELSFQTGLDEILVYVDTEKLEKIYLNLFINAIKFTPGGGKIMVRITKEDKSRDHKEFPTGYTEITVANSGIGIPPEHLDHIFDYFYQANTIGNPAYSSSGLGLSLVKELVTLHHGAIEVKSSIDESSNQHITEFIIRLPLGREHFNDSEIIQKKTAPKEFKLTQEIREICIQKAVIKESDSEYPDISRDEKKKNLILLIEDNTEMREYLREGLENECDIIEAGDGEEGVKKARKVIPDLVVSDVMMPGMDGYEVTRILKGGIETSHIPVILLTAKTSEENIIRGLEHGADDYITKPFNLKIVKARIRNLIRLRRGLQEKMQKQLLLQPSEFSFTSIDRKFLNNLHSIIEENIADQEFNIEICAKSLFMSKATLNRKIKALTGQSSNQYIQSYRLRKAVQLLQANYGNVTEVCYAVGFTNSAYFTKCFKKAFHQLPSQFQAVRVS
ncbi:MAG: response regulator [Spirochaetales bacterium]|nr:response regulator [Spirochaetales bacterium]